MCEEGAHPCVHVRTSVRMCVCVCVCARMCVYVCMRACVCVSPRAVYLLCFSSMDLSKEVKSTGIRCQTFPAIVCEQDCSLFTHSQCAPDTVQAASL